MLGRTVGNYRVVSKIGAGGMGVVYLARHLTFDRPVAIKVLRPELSVPPERVSQWLREAGAATAIRSPGIVEVFDVGFLEDRSPYVVMEYLEGESLAARIRNRRSGIPEALAIVRGIARALQAAHDRGIVHRDLKPDNVFAVPDPDLPGGERVKLLDFGMARLFTDAPAPAGAILGTPAYMAPEQCLGAGPVDHRADLYALGCIAYELVCGRPPFVGDGAADLITRQLYFQPAPLRSHRPDAAAEVDALVLGLLQKDPTARPGTALDVLRAIDRLAPPAGTGPGAEAPGFPSTGSSYPRTFGPYLLLAGLRRAGMGALHLAILRARGFERLIVLKTLAQRLAEAGDVARFRRDADAVIRLSHRNLVQVLDAGLVGDEAFLAMEFVEGSDLRTVWNRCAKHQVAFPIDLVVYIVKELCRGLAHVHACPDVHLVHRNVSPPNVLVSYTGDIKLADFGLALSAPVLDRTEPGFIYGKVGYLSPEQARHEELDGRSDMYAAGVMLWELLTGRALFRPGQDQTEDLIARKHNPHVMRPSQRAPRVPDELDTICLRALAADKRDRYADCDEMAKVLQAWLWRHAPTTGAAQMASFLRPLFAEDLPRDRTERAELISRIRALALTLPPGDELRTWVENDN